MQRSEETSHQAGRWGLGLDFEIREMKKEKKRHCRHSQSPRDEDLQGPSAFWE